MKTIVFSRYGSSDLLDFKEVERPVPKDDEVLIKVHAASVNALDWHIMRGEPKFARISSGLRKPKHPGLGADVAGTIIETGKKVSKFKTFDEVYGALDMNYLGSFAEYVITNEKYIIHKPGTISFKTAASLPVAALTAYQGLRDKGKIKSGLNVLVNGASGGVGNMALQIAKSFGNEVTGVSSSRNHEMLKLTGADHVIDYHATDFTNQGIQYDLIYDAVGNRSIHDLKRALTPKGICVIAGFTNMSLLLQHAFKGMLVSRKNGKTLGLMKTAHMVADDLAFVGSLVESGKVKPFIDKEYSLENTADAITYLETSRARGKVLITINNY